MLQGSRRISCLVSLSVCWPGCTSWIQSQGKLVTLLYISVFVKKDDDVSLTFFSVIPTISGFNAKSITFIFFNLASVKKCTGAGRLLLIFSIQQKACFTARFALKRRVFCSLGPGVHSGQVQLWFACRCLLCVFLDDFCF